MRPRDEIVQDIYSYARHIKPNSHATVIVRDVAVPDRRAQTIGNLDASSRRLGAKLTDIVVLKYARIDQQVVAVRTAHARVHIVL